jgi:hypothetical protein
MFTIFEQNRKIFIETLAIIECLAGKIPTKEESKGDEKI